VGWRRAEEENIQLKRALKQRYNFENIVGKSEPMLKIFDLVAQVANSRSTVLLQARAAPAKSHRQSAASQLSAPRPAFRPCQHRLHADGPARIHSLRPRKSAFTSAIASKKGLFEMADRGTLSSTKLPPWASTRRPKFCACCKTGASCISRSAGSSGGCAHHRCHQRRSAAGGADGRFREDLFYRLNVITIELPPLRQRREDIPLLVDFFLKKYAEENDRPARHVTPEALRPLLSYSWPGNVRELENVIERAVVLSPEQNGIDLLPDHCWAAVLSSRCTILGERVAV